jgi:hypothetical protein
MDNRGCYGFCRLRLPGRSYVLGTKFSGEPWAI